MNQGVVKLILLIIIAAVILGYFGINLESIWNSEAVQKNLNFLWTSIKTIWNKYLFKPMNFVWNIFYNYLWLAFIENMERLKRGEEPAIFENMPQTSQGQNY
jgi:hypothetical protein